jgi:DNA-binding IclR family transcriptional regulator
MILPFNEHTSYSIAGLSNITGFSETETKRILKTWIDFGMLLRDESGQVQLNLKFTKYWKLT